MGQMVFGPPVQYRKYKNTSYNIFLPCKTGRPLAAGVMATKVQQRKTL